MYQGSGRWDGHIMVKSALKTMATFERFNLLDEKQSADVHQLGSDVIQECEQLGHQLIRSFFRDEMTAVERLTANIVGTLLPYRHHVEILARLPSRPLQHLATPKDQYRTGQ